MKWLNRLLEMLFFGSIIEVLAAFIMASVMGQDSALSHLHNVFNASNAYMDSSYFVGSLENVFDAYLITPASSVVSTLSMHLSWLSSLLQIALLGFAVFVQKALIALVSIPVFAIFIIIGAFDGLIFRELRRYRAGFESTKRENFEFAIRTLTRIAFIGFVSMPIYIPAPLWFMSFGVMVGALVQVSSSFIQKYW